MDRLMQPSVYSVAATRVRKYVQSKMDIGASNQLSNVHHFGVVQACVAESRRQIVKDLKSQASTLTDNESRMKAEVDTFASWARQFGCGNCAEQSAMAFVQLRDVDKVGPLDWMQIDGFAHAFVVLGRIAVTNPENSATWNGEAFVCDPWDDYAGSAAACSRLRGRKIGLLYRIA